MSTVDRVGELEKETQVPEPTPNNSEETPVEETLPEEAAKSTEDEVVDWEARALKAEEVAGNYKKENEKHRKSRKLDTPAPSKVEVSEDQVTRIKNNFESKQQDVIAEFRGEMDNLDDAQWSQFKNLAKTALTQVRDEAIKQNRLVASPDLRSALTEVLSYTKHKSTSQEDLKKARLDGISEAQKADAAEISGVKTAPRPSEGVTAQDRAIAEKRDTTPEKIKAIRELKEKRKATYAVKDPVGKHLNI